jgi:citrate synthase
MSPDTPTVESLRTAPPGATAAPTAGMDDPAPPRDAAPRGLEGVIVAETAIGDVRGREGYYHYRGYPAPELARLASFEDVWCLLAQGELPDADAAHAFRRTTAGLRDLPPGLAAVLPALARSTPPLAFLTGAVAFLAGELGWGTSHELPAETLRAQALQLASLVPTILAVGHRLACGAAPLEPVPELPFTANYLRLLLGDVPDEATVRAVEEYLILTIDHGFNASTFAARVITSTGAGLAPAVCGAIGALSGPLHGGAPSLVLEMLHEIGTPAAAEAWIRSAVNGGGRIMGFGHRVYRTEDPRSHRLRQVAEELDAPLLPLARAVEETTVRVLAELKPGRELHANVELYAAVVLDACGLPPAMFTPTFTVARTVGWCANVVEQHADNRLYRPAARYVGPASPREVPGGAD